MNVAMCYLSFLFPEANAPLKRGGNDFMPLNQTSVMIEMRRIGEGGRWRSQLAVDLRPVE